MKLIYSHFYFIFLFFIFSLLLLGFRYFKKDKVAINDENISVFAEKESTYYLKKADKNNRFEIETEDAAEEPQFTLLDEEGIEMEASIKKISDTNTPRSGYNDKGSYSLHLDSGSSFKNESLADAESLFFTIEREAVEDYIFTDQVVEVEESEEIIRIDGFDGKIDQLVYGLNQEGASVLYKITKINEDGSFLVILPALDEIYSELDIYGEYPFDFEEVALNPEIEGEIVQNIKESPFYSSLIRKAYAEENTENVTIEVEILLLAKRKIPISN